MAVWFQSYKPMQQDKASSGLQLFFAHAWPSSAFSLSWSEEWMMSCGAAWWNPNCQPRSQSRGGRDALCWSVCRDAWEWAAHRWPVTRSGCLPDLLGRREKRCHGNGQLQGDHRGNGREKATVLASVMVMGKMVQNAPLETIPALRRLWRWAESEKWLKGRRRLSPDPKLLFWGQLILPKPSAWCNFRKWVCCLHQYLNKILFLQELINTHFLLISEPCKVLSEIRVFSNYPTCLWWGVERHH